MALKVFGVTFTTSLTASIVYSLVSFIIFIIVCIYGWKRLNQRADAQELKGWKKFTQWASLVWKMKTIYLSALVHIYDIGTDVGIIVDWGEQAFAERDGKVEVRGLNMMGLWTSSLVAFLLYRFISAGFVYEFTGKFKRAFIQFWDLEIYNAIYITHKLGRDEAGNLQRWLQKFEAIFESAPQSLLQLVYIVKTADFSLLIMSSIVLSFFSVAARFTSDDRIFFVKEAESLGLKLQRRYPRKNKKLIEDDDDDIEDVEEKDTFYQRQESNSMVSGGELVPLDPSVQEIMPTTDARHYDNRDIQIRNFNPNDITIRYRNGNKHYTNVTKCKIQTAKINPKTVHEDLKSNKLFWSTKVHDYDNKNTYCIKGLESSTDYMVRLCHKTGKKYDEYSEPKMFKTPLFRRWKIWNYLGYNRAYLFRYSFRMCDVFSRLMILALIWCVLSGSLTFLIIFFEGVTVVIYAQQIKKYNFFQFLVATYFSEDNRKQTVSYCFFRRMESLFYLIIVSYVILFRGKYNNDTRIDCWKNDLYCPNGIDNCQWLDSVAECNRIEQGSKDNCDCQLSVEVYVTKILLILAWSFANLSGDVFFGAFNSMRKKFGTNERNIVNVMEKRDWGAFSEMLQFGYRMNRFDDRSQRSGLSTFLDRIPSDKFSYEEIERMIQLGANINDVSIKPKDSRDNDEPLKVGDNVLIRYIKVTPCNIINIQFDDVVKKWTTTGVTGGPYRQDIDRIKIDINAKNENGYSAFKVYWEKLQYERRIKVKEKSYISARKKHIKKEYEYDEDEEQRKKEKWIEIKEKKEDEKTDSDYDFEYIEYKWDPEEKDNFDLATRNIEYDEKDNKEWFRNFYENLIKWQELGADMSTLSEDGLCPLQTYVTDINNKEMSMDTIKLYCPIDGVCPVKNMLADSKSHDDEEEEKYELKNMDTFRNVKKAFFVAKDIRSKAFTTWYRGHDFSKQLFDIEEIKIWHELGATDVILKSLKPLNTYLTTCEIEQQNRDVIDALIECGDSFENTSFTQYPCKCPLPIVTIIDEICNNRSANINLELMQYLHDEYKVPIETNGIVEETWKDVTDKDTYTTQLAKYIKMNCKVNLQCVKDMIKMGFIITRKENSQKYIRDAVTNSALPFDLFEFLLDNFIDANSKNDSEEKMEEFDGEILNTWIRTNEHIIFPQIKTLVEKYGFSLYVSNNSTECAIHYIWKNKKIPFSVMYDCWKEYGEKKFGKFEGVYEGFLYDILEKRKIRKIDEIKYLETIFSDFVGAAETVTGNTWIHGYCKNKELKLDILKYICNKYSDQLRANNKNGDKPIHLLCKNSSLEISHLKYFVVELGVPMDITNDEGFQPYEALHYLVDNKSAFWTRRDMEIMVHDLKINFQTRRAGEIILYRISKFKNWSIESLIYLYKHYKDNFSDIIDLNKLKSAKEMWREKKVSGGSTILMHLIARREITPNQITRLVEDIGLDITARDNDNKSILHTMATSSLTAICLKTVGNLIKKQQGDDFVVDIPDKNGVCPFQKWLYTKEAYICWDMDVVAVWEELGADITQSEQGGANNMLHHYISGYSSDVRLAHLRKMCFDIENPWRRREQALIINSKGIVIQNKIKEKIQQKRKRNKFQLPLHAKPVPNNSTLFRMYFDTAIYYNEPININVLEYFKSKKEQGVRAVLDTTESVLWLYMKHRKMSLAVVKYLIEDMGCSVMPTESDNLVIEYFKWLSRREKIDWDILDYFYNLYDSDGNKRIDFLFRQREYVSILHKYCYQLDNEDTRNQRYYQSRYYRRVSKGSRSVPFSCKDFKRLISSYNLESILDEWVNSNDANKSTNPSPAALFYEHRAHEIRPDIIKLFHKELKFDIHEPINNRTPLQNYCAGGRPSRYILESIVESFISDGGANPNSKLPGQSSAAMCQVMANSVDIQALILLVNKFNVKLINAKKRAQDVWYTFMDSYSGGFNEFVPLIKLYIETNKFQPIHLFHDNKKDKDKRIQFKLYKIFRYGPNGTSKLNDEIKYSDKERDQFKLKKNKKKLKLAKKLNNRIVIVTDSRDGLFRACKPIDSRSYDDGQPKEIPQKWLFPITYEYMIENINEMHEIYKSYHKAIIGSKLARTMIIIDCEIIQKINEMLLNNKTLMKKKHTINDIKLRSNNNLLMKYIKSNHRSDINANDINEMAKIGLEFKKKNDNDYHALDLYCKKSKGELNKSVVEALIDGGCPINWPYEEDKKKKDDEDSDTDDSDDDDEEEKVNQILALGFSRNDALDAMEAKKKKVTQLSALGFSRNEALKAMEATDNKQVELAAQYLLTDEESRKKQQELNIKRDVIKGDYTPLHHYCMLKESNLNGFKILVECGADVTIESRENVSAMYYLLKNSENLNEDFIKYLVKICKINFNRLLPSGWNLFNHYLNTNKNIDRNTIIALCDIAECDPHARDDENDTSAIKAYIQSDIATFKFDIISCLVELGAHINEPDNEGIYPIQHVLQLEYTPIKKLMKYLCNMIEAGSKLSHILPDDPLSIDDNKLFILKDMKDGYEAYNGYVCRIESWTWGRKKKQKIQTAIALDTFGATKLYIRIRRQNLIDVTKEMLFKEYPKFKIAYESQLDVDNIGSPVARINSVDDNNQTNNNNNGIVEEEEQEQEEKDEPQQPVNNDDNTQNEIHNLMSGQI